MRLTWRDGAATVLAALVVAVLLAVTQAWSWPLLGDYRAGVVALTILGFGMCSVGMRVSQTPEFTQPLMVVATLLGVLALGLVISGLIFATQALFVALAVTLLVLWALATVHHATQAVGDRPLPTGA